MKLKHVALLACLLLAPWLASCSPDAEAWMSPVMIGGGVEAAGQSCPGDAAELVGQSGLNVAFYDLARSANETYAGQGAYDPGDSDQTICSVDVSFRLATGVGLTVQVEIWEMDGNNLGASAGTGDCVSEAIELTSANDMQVHSFGDMSCTLDNTKTYGIVATRSDHSWSADNYAQIYLGDVGSWSGQWYEFKADKSYDTNRSYDIAFDLNGF